MSILGSIADFFNTYGFMPHGMCLLWRPSVLWPMVIGNAAIALAYFIIPLELLYLILKRRDITFKWIFVLFGTFILACGLTHVMAIITLWIPVYGLEALVLAFTGAVSMLTAILLWPLLPILFKIPSPWMLEKMNNALKQSEAHKAAILEAVSNSIITLNEEGLIESYNQETMATFQYSSIELLNKKIDILIPNLSQKIPELYHKGPVEMIATLKSGEKIYVEVNVSKISINNKNWDVVIIHNINEQKLNTDIILNQQTIIRKLSTPVFQLKPELLILPIIGEIDSTRARQITDELLRTIRSKRGKVVILDITAVPIVDSEVADHLIHTVDAVKLMGAIVIISGISAEIAQTLVTLGVDLSKIRTIGDLQAAIEVAENMIANKSLWQIVT